MSAVIRLGGLALIAIAALILGSADRATFAALGVAFLFGIGFTGFALSVFAGQVTPSARREVDGEISESD